LCPSGNGKARPIEFKDTPEKYSRNELQKHIGLDSGSLAGSVREPTPGWTDRDETPVSVKELKRSSISKLINTTGTALATYSVEMNAEMSGYYNLADQPLHR
jgi:hypothetical protein